MSAAAAAKRTLFAAVSLALLVALSFAGLAGGAPKRQSDRLNPSTPGNIHVTSASSSSVSVAWDPSQDNIGVAGYYVSANGRVSTVSSPSYTIRRAECGDSVFVRVVAFDFARNRSRRAGALVSTAACTDAQAPSTPTGFVQQATTSSAVVLSWVPSRDNVGVVGYSVYRNLLRIASPVDPTVTLSRLACDSSNLYQVDAVDAAGNRSLMGTVVVRTAACRDTEPPTSPTDLVASGRSDTSISLAWSTSTDDVGVAGYRVSVDGRPRTKVSGTTASISGLSCETAFAIGVDAFDLAGNRSPVSMTTASTSPCPESPEPSPGDATSPSTPTGVTASGITQNTVTLSWGASHDDTGVTGYDVYRGGNKVSSVTGTSVAQSGLTCGTGYSFAVSARDAAGNVSSPSQINVATAACSTTPQPPAPDTAPPSQPSSLAASGITQNTVTLSWGASHDDTGVTGYDVYRGGNKVSSVTGTSVAQSGLTCGTGYSFAVSARDAAGNVSSPSQINVATAACSTTPQPPAPDTAPPSQPSSLATSSATRTSIDLTWSASSDNLAVTGYGTYVNGATSVSVTQTSRTVSGLSCGTAYTFGVDAVDAAGNRSTRSSVTGSTVACADTQPPTQPSNVVASSRTATSIALTWTSSTDNLGVTGYGLYRAGAAAGSSTSTTGIFTGLSCNTNYTLSVDAADAAGNRSAKAVVLVSTTSCPDTAAPTQPTGLATSNVSQGALSLVWKAATDNVGVTGYDVYRNGTKVGSTSATTSSQSGLACGTSYTWGVEAYDAAGNRSQRAQVSVVTTACSAPPPAPPSTPPTPPTPPAPPAGCAVALASMTAPGCSVMRDDSASQADATSGLWGQLACASSSRYAYEVSGGDPRPKANGSSQGNTAYRELTVGDGDSWQGESAERCELGRNTTSPYYTESSSGSDAGTFALSDEGQHKIIFFSQRYHDNFDMARDAWQVIFQNKQNQPYAANGPVDGAPALEIDIYGGNIVLRNFWDEKWSTPAPPKNTWIRYAVEGYYSKDSSKGWIVLHVDRNGDGDFLDAGEVSPKLSMPTLAYVTSKGSSPRNVGDAIPSHMRIGIYHNAAFGTSTLDFDNVQVVG